MVLVVAVASLRFELAYLLASPLISVTPPPHLLTIVVVLTPAPVVSLLHPSHAFYAHALSSPPIPSMPQFINKELTRTSRSISRFQRNIIRVRKTEHAEWYSLRGKHQIRPRLEYRSMILAM